MSAVRIEHSRELNGPQRDIAADGPTANARPYNFTYQQEIGPHSTAPHHPSADSGVTIGPGFDMRDLTQEQARAILQQAGVDTRTAAILSQGAGLRGELAEEWKWTHPGVQISAEAQQRLFETVLTPIYEGRVERALERYNALHETDYTLGTIQPWQREVLFDYAYNGGLGEYPKFMQAILEGNRDAAVHEYVRNETREGHLVPLGRRNDEFYEQYLAPGRWEANSHQPIAPPVTPSGDTVHQTEGWYAPAWAGAPATWADPPASNSLIAASLMPDTALLAPPTPVPAPLLAPSAENWFAPAWAAPPAPVPALAPLPTMPEATIAPPPALAPPPPVESAVLAPLPEPPTPAPLPSPPISVPDHAPAAHAHAPAAHHSDAGSSGGLDSSGGI